VSQGKPIVNLTFHGIGEPERPFEPGENEVWVSTERYVTILDSVRNREDVRVTFDDGNSSDYRIALPDLRSRGLKAAFFVTAGFVDRPGYLSQSEIRELADCGMRIGTHGMNHQSWRGLCETDLRIEIVDSKRLLEQILGQTITEAACPFGGYNRHVLKLLRESGFERVYTSDRGLAFEEDWLQPRNTVYRDLWKYPVEPILSRPPTRLRARLHQLRAWRKRLR